MNIAPDHVRFPTRRQIVSQWPLEFQDENDSGPGLLERRQLLTMVHKIARNLPDDEVRRAAQTHAHAAPRGEGVQLYGSSTRWNP